MPGDAKEAFAFALLAYETMHRRPANLPSATGAAPARHPRQNLLCAAALSYASERAHKVRSALALFACVFRSVLSVSACRSSSLPTLRPPSVQPGTVTFLIETMPANLDPRIGTDAHSERIDGLLFNSLVERDAQMNLRGDLAERWETPDPLTYVFHLRRGVHFHDGRPLTSADVKFTFDSVFRHASPAQTRAHVSHGQFHRSARSR